MSVTNKIFLSSAAAIPVYSLYSMAKLNDRVKGEISYSALAIGVGVVGLSMSAASALSGTQTKLQKAAIYATSGLCASGLSYVISRGIFKANPKKSFIISTLIFGAIGTHFIYENLKKNG